MMRFLGTNGYLLPRGRGKAKDMDPPPGLGFEAVEASDGARFVKLGLSLSGLTLGTKSAPDLMRWGGVRARVLHNWAGCFHDAEALASLHAVLLDPDPETCVEARNVLVNEAGAMGALEEALRPRPVAQIIPPPPEPAGTGVPGLAVAKLRLDAQRTCEGEPLTRDDFGPHAEAATGLLFLLLADVSEAPLEAAPWEALCDFTATLQCDDGEEAGRRFGRQSPASDRLRRLLVSKRSGRAWAELSAEGGEILGEFLGAGRHGVVNATADATVAEKRFSACSASAGKLKLRRETIPRILGELVALERLSAAQEASPSQPSGSETREAHCQKFVVDLVDFGRMWTKERELFIAMRRAPSTLKQWRAALDTSSDSASWLAQCMRVCEQLAAAVAFIADHGVVHYDLRLDNILVADDRGTPLLADFGEAHASAAAGGTPLQFESRGTECVKAPEMLTVSATSAAIASRPAHDRLRTFEFATSTPCDVWSLGCLMFELWTLEFLYQEALAAWSTFFTRLTNSTAPQCSNNREAQQLPLVPVEQRAKLEALVGAERGRVLADDLLLFALVRDPRRRPTARSVQARVVACTGHLQLPKPLP